MGHSKTPLFLCVDCGGSKTSVAICGANAIVLGRALGGPSNFSNLPLTAFLEAVRVAVSNALESCVSLPSLTPVALPPSTDLFTSAWFGIAGVDSPAAVQSASLALSGLLGIPVGPRLTVANDTHLLAAPLRLHSDVSHAITAIAGTGSCVVSYSRAFSGMHVELARIGGWGWILGDEGSGFHVGREAIRQLMLDTARDSLGMVPPPKSSFKSKILSQFGIDGEENAAEILPIVYRSEIATDSDAVPEYLRLPREKRLSQLSPLVFAAAFIDGDEFALRVLRNTAGALADQIAALSIGAGEDLTEKPRGVVPGNTVLCFGGSLVGIEDYRGLVLDELKKRGCVFRYVEFVDDAAAVGAAGLAAMAANAS
ncbi:hypothetical protein ID866_685 [Astraeus odoratus]|nr:hypothetical protein ID866_685 [Astraeus odoratus]